MIGVSFGVLRFFIVNWKAEPIADMYPLYWTPSRGGIIMRYTYEYKRKCVEPVSYTHLVFTK